VSFIQFPSTPDLLIRKLENFAPLSDEEKRALGSAIGPVKAVEADTDIVRQGERPSAASLIVKGFACRYQVLSDGRRQIMAFHVPGDIVDLHSLLLDEMDHSIGTITTCEIAPIPHRTLLDIVERYPRIAQALWSDTLIDGAIFRQWMVGIGRRSAYERIAHFLCEMLVKLKAVGLAQDHTCELPITQSELADALGLSTVHVNRVVQRLRREGLITLRGTTLVIHDWGDLAETGEFSPAYLHLGRDNRAMPEQRPSQGPA
jgi:CRP-like cAMP-binding protein